MDQMQEVLRSNFGGWILALIIVLLIYAAVDAFFPQYANAFAIITILGIVMFQMNRKKD